MDEEKFKSLFPNIAYFNSFLFVKAALYLRSKKFFLEGKEGMKLRNALELIFSVAARIFLRRGTSKKRSH